MLGSNVRLECSARFLGGAALQRCDIGTAFESALAAEVDRRPETSASIMNGEFP